MASEQSSSKKTSAKVARTLITGQFVSSPSAAFKYYSDNAGARKAAVGRFENRVKTTHQSQNKPVSSSKRYRRGA